MLAELVMTTNTKPGSNELAGSVVKALNESDLNKNNKQTSYQMAYITCLIISGWIQHQKPTIQFCTSFILKRNYGTQPWRRLTLKCSLPSAHRLWIFRRRKNHHVLQPEMQLLLFIIPQRGNCSNHLQLPRVVVEKVCRKEFLQVIDFLYLNSANNCKSS